MNVHSPGGGGRGFVDFGNKDVVSGGRVVSVVYLVPTDVVSEETTDEGIE